MAVIDVCTINDEAALWEIHYHTLKDYVDEFIVVEFDKTFSGKDKELLGERTDIWYTPLRLWQKVRYVSFSEKDWEKYRELAESSPNTQGASHWKTEFMQKECIKDALTHVKNEDIVFIGDVDEVWHPEFALEPGYPKFPVKLKLLVYAYYLNNRSSEEFAGTLVGSWGDIKHQTLNHLRSNAPRTPGIGGWHFTSMGGPVSLRKKLEDSYTHESYATPEVLANLEYNVQNGKDFLGRPFTYKVDESQWPQYLKDNRAKYEAYLK